MLRAAGASASTVVGALSVTVGALYVKPAVASTQPAAFGFPNSTDRLARIVAQVCASGTGMLLIAPAAPPTETDVNCSKVNDVPPAKIGWAADQWSVTGVPVGGKFAPVMFVVPGLNAAAFVTESTGADGANHVMNAAGESAHAPHANTARTIAVVFVHTRASGSTVVIVVEL